jgi:hypothetical protein
MMSDTPDAIPPAAPDPEPEENEVLRETRRAKQAGSTTPAKHRFGWKTAAAAAGIGSAALAAALLYANRNKN